MVLLESRDILATGQTAPDFELLGIDGRMHTRAEYKSKEGLLVVFMCNHCPFVQAKTDALNEIYQTYGNRIGMVGINSNDAESYPEDSYDNMKRMAAEKGYGFDYLVDETQEIARLYGAMCTPDPFLFNADHHLVFHGRLDDGHGPEGTVTTKTMLENIRTMLEGEFIEEYFDPAVGCSIKWKN